MFIATEQRHRDLLTNFHRKRIYHHPDKVRRRVMRHI